MENQKQPLNEMLSELYRFIKEECIPIEEEVDRTDEIPESVVQRMRELGLFGHSIPTEYGGGGLNTEELARVNMVVSQAAPAFSSRATAAVLPCSAGAAASCQAAVSSSWAA